MATVLVQTSEASTTTFKDYALEISYFALDEESLCKTSKVYGGENAGNLISILSL